MQKGKRSKEYENFYLKKNKYETNQSKENAFKDKLLGKIERSKVTQISEFSCRNPILLS